MKRPGSGSGLASDQRHTVIQGWALASGLCVMSRAQAWFCVFPGPLHPSMPRGPTADPATGTRCWKKGPQGPIGSQEVGMATEPAQGEVDGHGTTELHGFQSTAVSDLSQTGSGCV